MKQSACAPWIGAIASIGFLWVSPAIPVAAAADPAVPAVPAVNQPDVPGGYESTYIIARLKPGTQPARLADGRWTVIKVGQAVDAPDADAKAIGSVLKRRAASSMTPVFPGPYKDPTVASQYGLDRWQKVAIPRGSDAPAVAVELKQASNRIEIAQADDIGTIAVVPNDPYFDLQWDLLNTGQNGGTVDADCDATDCWDIYQGSPRITLAIIDTGVQHFDSAIAGSNDHPDLASKVVTGWNTRDETNFTMDEHGHGTHCAGIAAAPGNNGVGVAGINWNVTIMAMRVTDPVGNCNQTDVAEAVNYAVNHGANVLSMSLQFYGGVNAALQSALAYSYDVGVLPIAATGNYAQAGTVSWPAKYPKCMGVGATDRFDGHAGFSNSGPEIDLCAPGAEIFGLWKDSNYTLGFPDAPVGPQSGTSMATPHVAGLAALMKSRNPGLSSAQLEHLLKVACEDKGAAGWDPLFGWGRINAREAIIAAARPADLNRNGVVNIDDLVMLITQWGACAPGSLCAPDINANGVVDIDDLVKLITDWG